jgi:hypothetical protein
MVRFVIADENTLGYIDDAQPEVLGILHASPLKGATLKDLDGWAFLFGRKLRPATREDFDEFRVCYDGYGRDTERYAPPN